MKNFFGSENTDQKIVNALPGFVTGLNESFADITAESQEMNEYATSMQEIVREQYAGVEEVAENSFEEMVINEDAADAGQVLRNSVTEMHNIMNENTVSMTNMSIIAATAMTIIKQPMETNVHRLMNSRAAKGPVIEIAEVKPTITLPGESKARKVYDALERGTDAHTKLEVIPTALQSAITLTNNSAKSVDLLDSMDPNYRMNNDLKLTNVTVELDPDGGADSFTTTDVSIVLQTGTRPYFDAKHRQLTAVYDVKLVDDVVAELFVDATLKSDGSEIRSITTSFEATPAGAAMDFRAIDVTFSGTVSHAQHMHPSTLSIESERNEFQIPTRPHYEISLEKESQTDIQKSNTGIQGDLITMMTNQALLVANHAEDLRILNTLGMDFATTDEAAWITSITNSTNGEIIVDLDFEPRAGYNKTIFDYVRESCVPALDQVVTYLKEKYHIPDSHARVLSSPGFNKHLMPDANTVKGSVQSGPAALSENLSAVSSTNTIVFVASSRVNTWSVKLVIIPNKKDKAERRTYDYWKYASFLTNDLRKASNHALPATVYSLRNAEVIGDHIGANINVQNYVGTTGSKILEFK